MSAFNEYNIVPNKIMLHLWHHITINITSTFPIQILTKMLLNLQDIKWHALLRETICTAVVIL